MNWNYVATFTGTGPISNLPTGTLDGKRENLWVMWGDAGQGRALSYFSHKLSQNGTSFPVAPTRLSQKTECSPCLMCVGEQKLVVLWVDVGGSSGWGVLNAQTGSLESGRALAVTVDGALAAVYQTDSLFVVMRGTQHREVVPDGEWSDLYYSGVHRLLTDTPIYSSPQLFTTFGNPDLSFRSFYSPAVARMPSGAMAVLYKGPGRPHASSSDYELYYTSTPQTNAPEFRPKELVVYPVPGKEPTVATATNRPSLALHGDGQAATLVAVFSGMNTGRLSYLVGTPTGGNVKWAAPPQLGTSDGTVPLDDLLAHAGPDRSPVKLTNPVGVWVTAPGPSNTLYLLVGDQLDGDQTHSNTIPGPLYLVRYMGHT